MAAFTLAALAAEVNADPSTLGYAALVAAGNDVGLADALNLARAGISVYRSDIAPKEIVQAIAPADFTAANQLAVSKLQLLFTGGIVDASLANVRGALQNLFSTASQPTKDALAAVCTRTGSRAEQLWGAGTAVTATQVANALGRY